MRWWCLCSCLRLVALHAVAAGLYGIRLSCYVMESAAVMQAAVVPRVKAAHVAVLCHVSAVSNPVSISKYSQRVVSTYATACVIPVQAFWHCCLQVAELATQIFITNDKPNVSGLVLSGSADFKTELSQSDMFDQRLAAIILGVVDVSYGESCAELSS